MAQKKRTVVHIVWVDSHSCPGWIEPLELTEFLKDKCLINTVGFLIYEDDEWYGVSPTIGQQAAADFMKIPKAVVKKFKRIAKLDLPGFDD